MASGAKATDSYRFQAEIKQLLHILVHSLYQDHEIFLRELISNASDALTQLHFHMLTDHDVHDADAELAIRLEIEDKDGEKWLIVKDSGVGMTEEELIQNLGTIAQSGARAFLQRMKEDEGSPGDIIGQFGVGFYSVFMVADHVHVVSRSYRPDAEAAAWASDGDEAFRIEPAEKPQRGTEIHIKLKEDAAEFASEWKLREIVKRHSDFVAYPIYLGEEQLNQQQPLWRKSPAEVAKEDYHSFYKQMTMDFEEPLAVIHFHSDAPIHLRALLFVPATRDRGILALRKEPGVKLYSHNVLIQEYNRELLPEWLRFVDGVVESEDLPLNVSRETVQSNRLMRQLGKTLKRRVIRSLEELAKEEDGEKYAVFWKHHGRTVKEGLIGDPPSVGEALPLLRYYSTAGETALTSFAGYAARKLEGQEAIYYVLGDSLHAVSTSPHLDPFRARDIEVLYWIDPLDSFLAPFIQEYQDTPVKNVDDAGLELPELQDDSAESNLLTEPEFNRLVGRCVKVLGDRVVEVRASRLLKASPVRLVSPEDTPNREMQRLYRFVDESYEVPRRILELNRTHPLVVNMAQLLSRQPDAALIDLAIEQLYESALIQEGLHPDPAKMVPRIEKLMTLAIAAQTPAEADDHSAPGSTAGSHEDESATAEAAGEETD